MKKWISIMCIVLLLCSAVTMSVSAAAGTGTAEDPFVCTGLNFNMVSVPAGQTCYVTFTDTTGAAKRQISINSTTDTTAGYVVTYGDTVANSDENGYCNMVVAPDANATYLLSITNNSTKKATFFINYYDVSPYEISDTYLFEGENAVTTLMADTTLFVFEPTETAIYEVTVDKADALLTRWDGSIFFVSGLAQEAVDGKLEVTCKAVGQSLLIGLSGVSAANITVTKLDNYTPPAAIDYKEYYNKHFPKPGSFTLPEGELTKVDITTTQTVVLGDDGIYRYGSADGPMMYVDLTGVPFADLYECYYPSSGGDVADRMRGTYLDENGVTCGYEFLNAMRLYADALDSEGFYYLTIDIYNYMNMFGKDQGWFKPIFSPFEQIVNNQFIEESAWLVNAYYIPDSTDTPVDPDEPSDPDEPDTPDEPVTPDEPSDPDTPVTPDEPSNPDMPTEPDAPTDDNDKPESPATGDVASFGAIATLLVSAIGTLTFSKKRK